MIKTKRKEEKCTELPDGLLQQAKQRRIEKKRIRKICPGKGLKPARNFVKVAQRERKQRTGWMERKTESGEGETEAETGMAGLAELSTTAAFYMWGTSLKDQVVL